MDGVSDFPFRHITKKYGKPDIVYTEFTSVEGICHGATRLLRDFLYDEIQRPVIAQIYGTTPRFFRQSAILLCELGFDGIDINMGCPAKNVAHLGAGAALIKTPDLASEIIRETKAGVEDWLQGKTSTDCPDVTAEIAQHIVQARQNLPLYKQQKKPVPVSVKTRIGYSEPVLHEWLPRLLQEQPAAIALHGRTLKQAYGGLADWDQIGHAVEIARNSGVRIMGNGDVQNREQALELAQTYGVDGVLIGRASFGNPFVFLPPNELEKSQNDIRLRFAVALEHCRLFEAIYGADPRYAFLPMRKHLGWYARQIPHAKELRMQLLLADTSEQVATLLEAFLLRYETTNPLARYNAANGDTV